MVPYYQGSLDGFCGIYSCVNATNVLTKDLKCDELFSKIVKKIGPKLARMALNGITETEMKDYVLHPTIEYLKKADIELSYTTVKANNLDSYWQTIQSHYENHGPGSIILSMVGVREHWTCVKKVTNKTVVFLDSGALNRLYRAHITIGEPTKKRKHAFIPEETFLLKTTL